MAFDLGMLGSIMRGGGNAPAPSHGAGPGALGELGRMKISQGYLELQRGQEERLREREAFERMESEKKTRQTAIDAWLGAVRSGNRADIWVLGKRLKSMGINVQMPDAFSASGVPSEADMAPTPGDDGPNFTLEERTADDELGDEITKRGKAAVDELTPKGRFMDLDTGREETEEEFNRRLGRTPPAAPAAPADFSPSPIAQPFGPGGPSALKPPASTWRVSDPVTGADIEIAPEQILADQEREIDQSFQPLIQMQGLDPIAQRAYQIGHEYAKGQLGFKTPKEAVDAGMAAADRYMTHMYRQGQVSAAQARAVKRAGGGGGAGLPEGTKSRIQLANEQAAKAEFKDTEATARMRIEQTFKRQDFAGALGSLNKARSALGSIKTGTPLGQYTAFREQMTAIESRLSNADAAYYEGAGGALNQLRRKYDYLVGKGNLTDADISAIRALLDKTIAEAKTRMSVAEKRADDSARAYLEGRKKLGQLSDEEYEVQLDIARKHIGGSVSKSAATTSSNKALLEEARKK